MPCDAAERGRCLLQVGHRVEALLRVSQRGLIERIGFGLDRSALPQVAVGREALPDETTHAGRSGRGQERVGSLGAQPVRGREDLVHVPAELDVRQRRGLMDDRIRLAVQHGLAHCPRVEQVELHRFGAKRFQPRPAGRRVVGADHLVPGVNQLRNEAASERAAGSGNEDSHRGFPYLRSRGRSGDPPDLDDVTHPARALSDPTGRHASPASEDRAAGRPFAAAVCRVAVPAARR